MFITEIEVTNRRIDPLTRDDCADVVFIAGEVVTRFLARAPRAASGLVLVKDAMRQLRRMPEFRSGQEKLGFAPLCLRGSFGN